MVVLNDLAQRRTSDWRQSTNTGLGNGSKTRVALARELPNPTPTETLNRSRPASAQAAVQGGAGGRLVQTYTWRKPRS